MVLVELHSIGKVSLKGVSDPVTLVDILPKQLFPRMRKRERLKSSTKAGVIECETQRIDPLNIVVPTAGILMELIKPMVHLKR
jgi:preprotein translocase subunit Sec61beta